MLLTRGSRLGPYEIAERIGAGGMGEVYSAHDVRLDRTVAVKVSRDEFSQRFEREARAAAALNHPNICTLHDVGPNYLVMEYISGPTVAERLATGPLPVQDALAIARQVAEAVQAAHARGIVHRDLKPANIKLTSDGKVKVLDFGLAKVIEAESASAASLADSPTMTVSSTKAGMLVGTAGYMSPEQARGHRADKQSDIWAFGVVLLEMLTGRPAFPGATVSDVIASVLTTEPDWSALPDDAPPAIHRLLRRCLNRKPEHRLHDIGDALIEIDEAFAEPAPRAASRRLPVAWLVSAAAVTACAAISALYFSSRPPTRREIVRFQFPMPAGTTFTGYMGISPDGRNISFAAADRDGRAQIYLRPLNELASRPLAAVQTSSHLYWAPDGRSMVFWSSSGLRSADIGGGPPQLIAPGASLVLGLAWTPRGDLIAGHNSTGLSRFPASGGAASPISTLDATAQEQYHCWPVLLPDGKHLLYLAGVSKDPEQNILYTAALDGAALKDRKRLLFSRTGAAYVPSQDDVNTGHILFLRQNTLLAQRFDAARREIVGEPFPVASPVGSILTRPYFSASRTGVIVYRSGGWQGTSLQWLDRQGKAIRAVEASRMTLDVALSNSGKLLAFTAGEAFTGSDIWVYDTVRGVQSRLTFGQSGFAHPVWAPDDSRVAFSSRYRSEIVIRNMMDGGSEQRLALAEHSARTYTYSWSADGKFILYGSENPKTGRDIWVMPLDSPSKPWPFLRSEFAEFQGQISPDSRWVAYTSDESGQFEVYVRSFGSSPSGGGGGKFQISTAGGQQPRWRGDGKELWYLAPNGDLMSVDLRTASRFEPGPPKALFHTRVLPQTLRDESYRYAASPDGSRFVVVVPQQQDAESPFTVIAGWEGQR